MGKPSPGEYRQSWIDPRVEVRETLDRGKGTFARDRINRGEVVIVWGGWVVTRKDLEARRFKSPATIGEGVYLAGVPGEADQPDDFTNHSCDPNLWMQDEATLAARKDIADGEELTADYAMWEADEGWVAAWKCRCGSPLCRKTITGRDWRLPVLQERYQDHFSPFVNERIARLESNSLCTAPTKGS
jgi:uncharacterized protein